MQKKVLKTQPRQLLTNTPDYRKCSICGQVKKLDQFYKDKSKLLGRRYGCKECESPKEKYGIRQIKSKYQSKKRNITGQHTENVKMIALIVLMKIAFFSCKA